MYGLNLNSRACTWKNKALSPKTVNVNIHSQKKMNYSFNPNQLSLNNIQSVKL